MKFKGDWWVIKHICDQVTAGGLASDTVSPEDQSVTWNFPWLWGNNSLWCDCWSCVSVSSGENTPVVLCCVVSLCVCWGRNPSRQTQVGNCPIKAVTAELIAAGGAKMNIKCYHRVSHAASCSAELWTAETWISLRWTAVRQANKQTHLKVSSPSERLHYTCGEITPHQTCRVRLTLRSWTSSFIRIKTVEARGRC